MSIKDTTFNQLYTKEILNAKDIISKITIDTTVVRNKRDKAFKTFQTRINKSKILHQAEKADLCGYLQTYLNQITL